jgi:hypothetical protein
MGTLYATKNHLCFYSVGRKQAISWEDVSQMEKKKVNLVMSGIEVTLKSANKARFLLVLIIRSQSLSPRVEMMHFRHLLEFGTSTTKQNKSFSLKSQKENLQFPHQLPTKRSKQKQMKQKQTKSQNVLLSSLILLL